MLNTLLSSLSNLDPILVPIHQRLISIRRMLAGIAARPKPALADAQHLKEELRSIDSKRVDGKWLGPDGHSIPAGQALLSGLMEENFDICQDIMARQEDIAFTLKPIVSLLLGSGGADSC